MVGNQAGFVKRLTDPDLYCIFVDCRAGTERITNSRERSFADFIHTASSFEVQLELLRRPASIEHLHEVSRGNNLDATGSYQIDCPAIHERDVGDGAQGRKLHGHARAPGQQAMESVELRGPS